ncbi:hypothetical protein CTAYLR_004550 [Chrysophaeum taylorii]|uniref:Inositol hexakisphosphate and diphosphoinositol-pentakisphosphate kinase n=1 Tax=Chrysophaeum taylorii TaxID=2483200 RepID=A0AAD7UNE6_9STRA|nr:hypothetical protein CTAYLR_004550 [Chrysophaeum taylorii]
MSADISLASRRSRLVVGVCAMAKKTGSKPMREILRRLPEPVFKIVVFEEATILEQPVEEWPVCDCLIAFHSHGFPLEKAQAYAALRRPFVLNDLRRQTTLRDRRKVYDALSRAGVPTPKHVAMSRDSEHPQTLDEYDDYIVCNGVRVLKPFVEKPVDADDHNVYIYYPMSAGGGSKRLFRKVDNKSSRYYADEHKVRRDGSYIYEEFVDTQGTDVKVYAVGPRSPALDGVVVRGDDGKELRYPVILSWIEKDIAFKIYHAFKQTVCGFDILRTHDGRTLVCDVNGWSFVKKSRKYYEDCAALLSELMEHRRAPHPQIFAGSRSPAGEGGTYHHHHHQQQQQQMGPALSTARRRSFPGDHHNHHHHPQNSPRQATVATNKAVAAAAATAAQESSGSSSRESSPRTLPRHVRELRCVIAVVRHGDRTPKRKLKVRVRHPKLVAVHAAHARRSEKKAAARNEAKIRESRDLGAIADIVREVLAEGTERPEVATALAQLRDVLQQHVPASSGNVSSLNTALFSGCKLQLKPTDWEEDASAPDGLRATEVGVVLKWGGVLTELGVEHACALGAHFRRSVYPASDDGAGLLRLHATFRHDLKIRTSDESRVMKTGAAFTKGLLELEGDISPILVSLIHRGRTDVHMLDRAGNHEAQDLLAHAKQHVERAFQVDVDTGGDDDEDSDETTSAAARARRLVAPDGPASVLDALRRLGNPRRALDELYDLVDGLVRALERHDDDDDVACYMGETRRVWLDSWRDVRTELRKPVQPPDWRYDLSKIPEIFDKVRFDAQHNATKLDLENAYPRFPDLVRHAQTLSQAVAPLEFGGAEDERRDVAWLVSRALIEKICFDLHTARGDANDGLHFQLDDDPQHLADSQIKSSWRAVRSRLYFTSESHLHALLTALRVPADKRDATSLVDEPNRRWLSDIPELSYLSHIVFRLWEDTSCDETDPQRHMVELSFSPGTKFDYDSLDDETKPVPSPPQRKSKTTADSDASEPPPTQPLEPFAYVPCQRLEEYFTAKPSSSGEDCLASATKRYEDLARKLHALAADQKQQRGAGATKK